MSDRRGRPVGRCPRHRLVNAAATASLAIVSLAAATTPAHGFDGHFKGAGLEVSGKDRFRLVLRDSRVTSFSGSRIRFVCAGRPSRRRPAPKLSGLRVAFGSGSTANRSSTTAARRAAATT